MIRVVNKYKENPDFYCGRGSIFGNPFKMHSESDRAKVCADYEAYFYQRIESDQNFQAAIQLLIDESKKRDITLGCYCSPKQCHCDTIKSYIEKQESKSMNICIAGSRDFNDYELLESSITEWAKNNPQIKQEDVTIISGGARGADKLGERFAKEYDLKLQIYPADWNQYGKSAGYKRNTQMAELT